MESAKPTVEEPSCVSHYCVALTLQATDAEPSRAEPISNPAPKTMPQTSQATSAFRRREAGQTNLVLSSRLCTSTSPVRSQTRILNRSAFWRGRPWRHRCRDQGRASSVPPPPAHQGHGGSRPDSREVSPRRSSGRRPAQSSRSTHRADHLRQLLVPSITI